MSKYTEQRLAELGMNYDDHRHMPLQCRPCDLAQATLTIALKEAEHRPMLEKHFNGWADRVTYWHVHDLDGATPVQVLAEIEQLVTELVGQLKRQEAAPMKVLAVIFTILASLILAAHFLHAWILPLVAFFALLPLVLLIRRNWAVRFGRCC